MMITKPSPSQTRNLTAPCSCVGFHCLNHVHFFSPLVVACQFSPNLFLFELRKIKNKNWELNYKNLKKEQKKNDKKKKEGKNLSCFYSWAVIARYCRNIQFHIDAHWWILQKHMISNHTYFMFETNFCKLGCLLGCK